MGKQEVHQGLEDGAGRIGPGQQHQQHLGLEVFNFQRGPILGARFDEGLQEVDATNIFLFFELAEPLSDQAITETHEDANARIVLGSGNEVLLHEGGLHPAGEGMQTSEETECRQTIVETLNEPAYVLRLLDEAKRGSETDLTDYVVRHVAADISTVSPRHALGNAADDAYTAHHEKSKISPV
jgi:hypothetical protein